MIWMLLVLVYGLLKGVREILKKKALTRNSVMEVLFLYTLISFGIVVVSNVGASFASGPETLGITGLSGKQLLLIAFKSFVIFIAWMCSFYAIKKLPISLYGILDLARVLFATLLGLLVLHESMTLPKTVGLVFVCVGLLLLKGAKKETAAPDSKTNPEKTAAAGRFASYPVLVVLAMISCLLNAVSGTMDKILMKNMTSGQLQFWYMLFLVLMYLIYILVTHTKMNWKSCFTNHWVWILSVAFVIADRCLFIANSYGESQVTVMTLIKQSGCIVTILGGKFIFKEKNIRYKLLCAAVIISGIVIAVL